MADPLKTALDLIAHKRHVAIRDPKCADPVGVYPYWKQDSVIRLLSNPTTYLWAEPAPEGWTPPADQAGGDGPVARGDPADDWPAARVLASLRELGYAVRGPKAAGEHGQVWASSCPYHGGRSGTAFRVGEMPNGSAWVKCWSGCSPRDALSVLRLWPSDLYRKGPRVLSNGASPPVVTLTATGEAVGEMASVVSPEAVDWLWRNRLPLGMLTILDGDPDLGKSTLTIDWAARITTGRPWPDGTPSIEGGAIILASEDTAKQVIVPRLMAAGADLTRVLIITTIPTPDGYGRLPSLPDDVPLLEREIRRLRARLLIFDPIMPYIAGSLNANRDGDVRRALAPLGDALERTACTASMLRHLSKDDKTGNALYRGLSSIAFIAVSRGGMVVAKDPDEAGRYILAPNKGNLGPRQKALRYGIEEARLGPDHRGREIVTSRIVWHGESDHTASKLVTAFGKEPPRQSAAQLLTALLADGAMESKRIYEAAEADGISNKTLLRAKSELGIRAWHEGYGPDVVWYWDFLKEARLDGHLLRWPLSEPDTDGLNTKTPLAPDTGHLKRMSLA